jgi:hypothetical protein
MATHIKSLIDDFLKKQAGQNKTRERLEYLLGLNLMRPLKKHTRLAGIYKNKLLLHTDCASYGYELKIRKQKLLKDVQREFPQIQDITITIG